MKLQKANIQLALLQLEAALQLGQRVNFWVVKQLSRANKIFLAPPDGLADMSFGEFVFVDSLYLQYNKKESAKLLDKIVTILYRSPRTGFDLLLNADQRCKFDTGTIDANAATNSFLFTDEAKQLILLNYSLVRADMCKKYPYIFPVDEKKEVRSIFDQQSPTTWLDIRDNLTPNVQSFPETDSANLHDVLRKLNKTIKENESVR